MSREAIVRRKTQETEILLKLNLNGRGRFKIDTGIPFLDHMLSLLAQHGLFDLEIKAKGDFEVGSHHTVEDVGISLGEALRKALGKKRGIKRYGFALIPMDESLARVAVDLSGRPGLYIERGLRKVKGLSSHDLKQFLKSFTNTSRITLHISNISGEDPHHILESIFKALGIALDQATQIDKRIKAVPSTKGRL